MTLKNLQFGYEMKINLKLFDDRILFGDRRVCPTTLPIIQKINGMNEEKE
jgi:hypothetical protein